MHRRGRSTEKADCRGGTTSFTVPTGGPVDGLRTGDRDPISPA